MGRSKAYSVTDYTLFLCLLISTNLFTYFWSSNRKDSSSCSSFQSISTETVLCRNESSGSVGCPEEGLPEEFVAYAYGQPLPFGFDRRFDSDHLYSSVGRACSFYKDDLSRYMSYEVNGSCPDDESLAQKLLLKGCEPLPRRRCRPAAPKDYQEPVPFPGGQWSTPPDLSVVWTAYSCKNYTCLVNRRLQKGSDDCKDCFHLTGRESVRWIKQPNTRETEFTIEEVLSLKKPGTIRIGLDIGGGSGTFAVRMRERNVTIVTTSMNFNAPFNNFIASRGILPLYITISQRLPFFDNTLDIVHSMHVLSNWIPTTLLHFMLFDIHRVLRPGGLFWLDHFFCKVDQWEEMYIPLIRGIGFNELKWVEGSKLDNPAYHEMYLSALLEKPLSRTIGD